ncbi:unnamed protein product [Notodromas monacha]|uniref:Uncharacterized protein n=1 Tax=Notodromas monacha TaxID=399045 RepID=A0A7R9BCI2_9CRUS|nr:unnamed protein product [Notodromas monacha]CAG0912744.1 unnamed protein product [Notodromas monacha]
MSRKACYALIGRIDRSLWEDPGVAEGYTEHAKRLYPAIYPPPLPDYSSADLHFHDRQYPDYQLPPAHNRRRRRGQASPAVGPPYRLEESHSPPPPAPSSPPGLRERPSKLDLPPRGHRKFVPYADETPSNLTPSDASDDSSSYLSARDSGVAMTSGSGSNTRFRFSPPLNASGVELDKAVCDPTKPMLETRPSKYTQSKNVKFLERR